MLLTVTDKTNIYIWYQIPSSLKNGVRAFSLVNPYTILDFELLFFNNW
jgi:hypothetical protein